MIRLFLALDIDPLAKTLIGELGRSVPGARTTPPEQLHLTLRFIGEVEGTMFHDIRERLSELSAPPLALTISGVGHFPPRGIPRVIWAGIKPSTELLKLRNAINRLLFECGLPPEKRKFHPHITLARFKKSSPGRVAQFLSENSNLEVPQFIVNEVTLYSSKLTSKGAIHTVESRYPLSV